MSWACNSSAPGRRAVGFSSAGARSVSTRSRTTPKSTRRRPGALGARTGLYVPLVARGRSIGVIGAHDKEGEDPRFSDDDLRLAETFATRAAVAVDLSARVAGDALRRVVEAQELERRRLARELHDQTGQELTSVLLGLKAVEEAKSDAERAAALAVVREQVVETLHDVRRLAVELRPKALDDFGLVPPSSACVTPSRSRPACGSTSSRKSASGFRPTSRPPSTASSRRR